MLDSVHSVRMHRLRPHHLTGISQVHGLQWHLEQFAAVSPNDQTPEVFVHQQPGYYCCFVIQESKLYIAKLQPEQRMSTPTMKV